MFHCWSVSRRSMKFNSMVSTDYLDQLHTHSASSEFHYGASPMSNISVQFVFALVVIVASLAASFAQHADLAATRKVPITPSGPSGVGKCFQGSRATAAERNRAEFVHTDGVCWAPQNTIDGPGG